MLKLFETRRRQRLCQALKEGDLERLARFSGRVSAGQLRAPLEQGLNALELTLVAGQAKALEWVLRTCPEANGDNAQGEPYLLLALRHPANSLALLSALLQAGADPNRVYRQRSLLHWCCELCAAPQLMLHLSRLVQHGATLEDDPELVRYALLSGQQPLLHFLIHSGAPLPDTLDDGDYAADLVAYARRCAEDRRIQQLMLGR